MSTAHVVPGGEALRRAVAWLAEQHPWTPGLIQEACQRFDVSPADEEFLLKAFGRAGAPGPLSAPGPDAAPDGSEGSAPRSPDPPA